MKRVHNYFDKTKIKFQKIKKNNSGSSFHYNALFIIYEPTMNHISSPLSCREEYYDYFETIADTIYPKFLNIEECKQAYYHVKTCDYPETIENWIQLGHDAGFNGNGNGSQSHIPSLKPPRHIFTDPNQLYSMFAYHY